MKKKNFVLEENVKKFTRNKIVYFLTEDEEFAIRIKILELGYTSISEVARKINYNPTHLAGVIAREKGYSKSIHEKLKSIGIDVVRIYD